MLDGIVMDFKRFTHTFKKETGIKQMHGIEAIARYLGYSSYAAMRHKPSSRSRFNRNSAVEFVVARGYDASIVDWIDLHIGKLHCGQ